MNFSFYLALLIFCFLLLRLIPIFLSSKKIHRYSEDGYYYIYVIRHLFNKRNGKKLNKQFLLFSSIDNHALYPYFASLFLRFLSLDFIKNYFNVVVDLLFSLSMFMVLQHFGFTDYKSFLLVVLYLLIPFSYSITNLGPRVFSFTPRLFSEIVSSLMIFSLYAFNNLDPIFIILFLFLSLIFIYLSKFALQVFFLLLIPAMILNGDYIPMFLSITIFIISYVLDKKQKIAIKAQIEHLKVYFWKNKNNDMHFSNRNSFKEIIELFFSGSIKLLFKQVYKENSFTSTFIKFLPFFYVLFFLHNSQYTFFITYIILSLILFLVINTKKFLFLGEAERYLLHVLFPIIIIFGELFDTQTLLFFISFYILLYCIELLFIYETYDKNSFDEDEEIYAYLNNFDNKRNIIANPLYVAGGCNLMLSTNHRVLNSTIGFSDHHIENMDKILHKYPILNLEHLDFLIEKYNIDTFISSTDYLNGLPNSILSNINQYFELTFSSKNNTYKLYTLKKLK